jgi:hypothetical protein
MELIKSPVLAYGLNLAYALLIVSAAFLGQDVLAMLGEDWSERVVIVCLSMGIIVLTGRSATVKCILCSIMGFQSGILIPVLLISRRTGYEIDWVKVWIVVGVISVGTFITALILRRRRQQKQPRIERATHD